jgi:hypothetical protein
MKRIFKCNSILNFRVITLMVGMTLFFYTAYAQPTGYTGTWGSGGCQGNNTSVNEKNWNHSTNYMGSLVTTSAFTDFEFTTTEWKGTAQRSTVLGIIFRHGGSNGSWYMLTYCNVGNTGQNYTYRLKKGNANNSNVTNQLGVYDAGSSGNRAVKLRVVGSQIQVDVNNDGSWEIDYTDPGGTPPNGTGKGFIKKARYNDGCYFKNVTWTEVISGSAPTISTTAITPITCNTATSGGNTIDDGGDPITVRGVCWNTGGTPTTADSKTSDGTGEVDFASAITGLTQGTPYHVRAYATNTVGTSYGPEVDFTAKSTTTAGSIGSVQTICYNTAPATLTNDGAPGNGTGVFSYQWQSSPDDADPWTNEGADASTYTPGAITVNTYYRRQATSSDCGTATSASILVTIDPASVGGSIDGTASVCAGTNGATLTLTGHVGAITRWEKSENGGVWTDIGNGSSATYAYSNITVTTQYRAVLTSGVCALAYSSSSTITVSPTSDGGTIASAGATTVCYTDHGPTTMTLSGHTGSITKWQKNENSTGWTDVSNTSTTQDYEDLIISTDYRAVVTSGGCASANSATISITVYDVIVPGTISW